MKKVTKYIRAEINQDYIFVRNLKGNGIIDAVMPENKIKTVENILKNVENETFSQVWAMLIGIKKVRFEYKNN
jgi:hypothetical protein